MSWTSALKAVPIKRPVKYIRPVTFPTEQVDWDRLVTVDLETYYDVEYTLSKLSTSEYIRDSRFKAQMVGIKIGRKATKVYSATKVRAALLAIPWSTHSLLAHHAQFDGFILSHHYGIKPKKLYCTMSMARGLHSNEIGAGLDELSKFYGGKGKIEGGLDPSKGVRNWSPEMIKSVGAYCAQDVDECFDKFCLMLPKMPKDEIDLIDITCRMFTDPVLKVNIPKVEIELKREIEERRSTMLMILPLVQKNSLDLYKGWTKAEKQLEGEERDLLAVKKHVGSNEKFAELLKTQGIDPPVKISPAWIKNGRNENDTGKWIYAFAKDDQGFLELTENVDALATGLDRELKQSATEMAVREAIVRALVDCRIAVKSTSNVARAQRFLISGANGMPLPAYYAYARAHTLRWGGGDKRNMQNLERGGALREAIEAPPGYQLVVVDSGQIEARMNAWLWGQADVLEAFRQSDAGIGRDPYCLMGDTIYGKHVTKADTAERFVGKVCILALGFQMSAAKLQLTLAKGALGGPRMMFTLSDCNTIVNMYRGRNMFIVSGWNRCKHIIEDMAEGRNDSFGPISWEKGKINLPNGMCLKYPELQQATGENGFIEWSYLSGTVRRKIYGGMLCENIVQCLSRILIGEQMLAISRKYRLVMTTHDECVTCVKTAQAKTAFEFMTQCFRTPAKWCQELPLNSEGGAAQNYSK